MCVISVFGKHIEGCPVALILAVEWKKMDVLQEYYEGWTYTILWNGKIETNVAHEWIGEISE